MRYIWNHDLGERGQQLPLCHQLFWVHKSQRPFKSARIVCRGVSIGCLDLWLPFCQGLCTEVAEWAKVEISRVAGPWKYLC